MKTTPIYDALIAEHPDVPAIMARPRWTYAAALKAADEAIATRVTPQPKRPAKKAAARKKTAS